MWSRAMIWVRQLRSCQTEFVVVCLKLEVPRKLCVIELCISAAFFFECVAGGIPAAVPDWFAEFQETQKATQQALTAIQQSKNSHPACYGTEYPNDECGGSRSQQTSHRKKELHSRGRRARQKICFAVSPNSSLFPA
jgi:hypothetical protein